MDKPDESDGRDDAAFCQRVARYLDGELAADDLRRLNAELLGDEGKRVIFVRSCVVRAALIREGAANRIADVFSEIGAGGMSLQSRNGPAAAGDAGHPMDETMILPAIHDGGSDAESDESVERFTAGPWVHGPNRRRRWTGRAWAAAAAAAVGLGLVWTLRPAKPPAVAPDRSVAIKPAVPPVVPAVVTAVAGIDRPGVARPGTELVDGQAVDLDSGAIELTFDSGATALVRAPAHLHVVDRNGLALESGSIYAHVPKAAVGFSVVAPGLRVLDHGTNFGVRTSAGATATEVHVFDGLVDATGLDADGEVVGVPVPVPAGHAAAHSQVAADSGATTVAFGTATFDRNISDIRTVVQAFGTGAGAPLGSLDSHWQIVAVSGDPSWKPQPAAVVLNPQAEYAPSTDNAKWVSTTVRMQAAPPANFTYRTTIDLTGFDPASVRAKAAIAADDRLVDVLVNGKTAHALNESLKQLDAKQWRTVAHDVVLSDAAWRPGLNQVDVVILNEPLEGGPNYTGMQLGWTITASLAVRR